MDERGIMIADRDGDYRKELADFFENAGYAVETTDSAVHVLCSILEKQTPVLLLGSDFDKKVSSADLIHLLKKCNRNLHVIMVSDDMPLAQARQVRQEGIFYHALKPSSPGDTEEIGLAVECAFGKQREEVTAAAQAAPKKADVCNCCGEGAELEENPVGSIWWLVALVGLVAVTSYFSVVAGERAAQGNSTGIWLFLGFCASIIATQLLPIFRINLPLGMLIGQRAKHEDDSREKK